MMCVCVISVLINNLFLDILQQKRGGSQIVHWDVEEALNLFLMEVHGDQVGEAYTNMVMLACNMSVVSTDYAFEILRYVTLNRSVLSSS